MSNPVRYISTNWPYISAKKSYESAKKALHKRELNTKINTGKLQDYLFRSPEIS